MTAKPEVIANFPRFMQTSMSALASMDASE